MKKHRMFLLLLLFITFITFLYLDNLEENYHNCTGYDYECNYDKQITNGRIVSGTVYDSNPPNENTGLGWIL